MKNETSTPSMVSMKGARRSNSTAGYYASIDLLGGLSFETETPELSFDWSEEECGARLEVEGLRVKDLVFATPRHPSFDIDLLLPRTPPRTPLAYEGQRSFRSKTASPSFAAGTVDSMPRLRSTLDRSSLMTRKVEEKVSHLAGQLLSRDDSDKDDDNRLPGILSRSSVGQAEEQLRLRNLARGLESIEKELGIGTYGGEAGKTKVSRPSARLMGTKVQVQRILKAASFRERNEEMEKKVEMYRKDTIEREMLQNRVEQSKLLMEGPDEMNWVKANKAKADDGYYKIGKQMERVVSRSEELHSKMTSQKAARKAGLVAAHESMLVHQRAKEERRIQYMRFQQENRQREFVSNIQKPLLYMFTMGTQFFTWGHVLVKAREFRAEHARQIAAAILLQRNMKNLTWIRRFNRFCRVKQWLRGKLWRVFMNIRIAKKTHAKNTLLEFLRDMQNMAEVLDAMKRYRRKVLLLQAQIRSIIVVRKNQFRMLSMQWNIVREKCRSLQLTKGERSPVRSRRSASVVAGLDPRFTSGASGAKGHGGPPSPGANKTGAERLSSSKSFHAELSPLSRSGSALGKSLSRTNSGKSLTGSITALRPPPAIDKSTPSPSTSRQASAKNMLSQSMPLPQLGRSTSGSRRELPVPASPVSAKKKTGKRAKKDGASSLHGINFLLVPESTSDVAKQMINTTLTKRRRAYATSLQEWRAALCTWKANAHIYRAEVEVQELLRRTDFEEEDAPEDVPVEEEHTAPPSSDPAQPEGAESGVPEEIMTIIQQRTSSFVERTGSAATSSLTRTGSAAAFSLEKTGSSASVVPGRTEPAMTARTAPRFEDFVKPVAPLVATLTWDRWCALGDEKVENQEYKQLGPPRPVFKLLLREDEEMIPLLGQSRK